jgi:restriction endonuclease S subunit
MSDTQSMITPAQPGAKLLGDLCEVLPGRNRVAREADADPDFRVVRAEDIGAELSAWLDLPPSTMRKRSSVEVAAGDIVGSISAPHGRWVVVPDGYGPTLASDHTVVLRKRSDVSMWYLLGFLRSDRGRALIRATLRGSVILRISVMELGQIPVHLSSLSL